MKTDGAHALAEMRGVLSQPAAPTTEGAFDRFLRRAAEDCINGGDRTRCEDDLTPGEIREERSIRAGEAETQDRGRR